MAFDFPAAPTEGQEYTPVTPGPTYVWNAPRWIVKGVPLTSYPGTKAQFDAALTDGDFVFQGDPALMPPGGVTGAVLGKITNASNATQWKTELLLNGGQALMVDGTAAAPALAFNNWKGVGFYLPSSGNALGVATAGAERVRVTDVGRVGIGTATPGKQLAISGGGMAFDEVGGAVRGIHWGDGANYPVTVNGDASTGALYFNTAPAGTAVSTERMRITSAGFVGVGTGTPSALLDVNGTAKAGQFFIAGTSAFYLGNHPTFGPIVNFDSNDYISYDTTGNVMSFAIGGVQRFRVDAAGVYTPGSMIVGDGAHSLYISGGNTVYAWDSGDYQFYDRTANTYNIIIGGVNRFNVSPTVINLGGSVNAGGITCSTVVASTHAISGTTGNPYISASDSTHVVINFDSNDYIMFDQTLNNMGFTVGGVNGFNVAAGYTLHPDGVGARFGDNNMTIYKSGTTGVIAFDANDYLQFNRTTNQWDFWLGGNSQFAIYGGGVSAPTSMATPIVWFGGLSDCYINAGGTQFNINPDANDALTFFRAANQWRFTINGIVQSYIDLAGMWVTNNIRPQVTNATQSGDTSYAWYNCSAYQYVNPSDAREKNWRGAATTPELTAARRIADELGFYSWKEGPSNGKLQFGLRAQNLARILMEEGVEATQKLDYESGVFVPEGERPAFEYGLVEFASWEDKFMPEPEDSGKEPELVQAAGNRFAVNHDQLSMFLIAAQAKQIEALEARLAALGG